MSFFGGKAAAKKTETKTTDEATAKPEENSKVLKEENNQKVEALEKNNKSASPIKETGGNKRQRESSPKKSPTKLANKLANTSISKTEEDEVIVEEKENTNSSNSKNSKSKKSEASDSEDSPIKKKSTATPKSANKRRKLVIESSDEDEIEDVKIDSSSSESSESEEEVKPKKKGKEKAAPKETKSKKPVQEKETKKKQTETKAKKEASPKPEAKAKKEASPKAVKKEASPKKEVKKEATPKKEIVSPKKEATEEVKSEETKPSSTKNTCSLFASMKKAGQAKGPESSSLNYWPDKDNYHPIKDACWEKGQPVPYKALAQTFYCMEKTTKRLELLSIVCNYFRSVLALTPKDLVPSVYLLTNKVAPDYENIELGIGDTVLFKALAEATGCTLAKLKQEFQTKGDIGLVAEANRCNQKLIVQPKKLNVSGVYSRLREIAQISGNSSQQKKCDMIKGLFVSCDSIEARYLMRSLAGKLRNGLGEQSILSSLAHACTITPPPLGESEEQIVDRFEKYRSTEQLEEKKKILEKYVTIVKNGYYQCPNYDRVIMSIITYGLDELEKHCKLTPGVPLRPMLAYPTKGIQEILKRFENIEFTCEYKYDGERAQIHILEDGSLQVYSRNLENNTSKYPDVIEFLQTHLNLKKKENDNELQVVTAILDAEVVAYDVEKHIIQPFQKLSTRKRKDAASEDIKVQVCLFAFDLLYLNSESLINLTLRQRRERLYKYFPKLDCKLLYATHMNTNDLDQIQEFLDNSIKDGTEGLMIKTLDEEAHYEISKRSHNWLKLKKDYLEGVGDTLDLVVIGGYRGTGKRTGLYGGYLLAVYDAENEEYQTVCKLGTGLKDNDLQQQFESLSKIKINGPKSYYQVDSSLEQPDDWFEAEQVWEIKCADFSLSPVHTAAIGLLDPGKGISLRFPRYLRLRDDKKPEDATNAEQLADMYKNQQQMINLADNKKGDSDQEEDMD